MANKNKNRRHESTVAVVTNKIPLVSVIIPMYNSAKFIPQTLESLLYQTMQDMMAENIWWIPVCEEVGAVATNSRIASFEAATANRIDLNSVKFN
mgnify:CR=1 FL=1